jgi:hypothetical protein
VAKYDKGDKVRLKKAIMGLRVRPNTIGEIKKIKGGWGSKEYHIRWNGIDHNVIMKGDKDFVELSQGEG